MLNSAVVKNHPVTLMQTVQKTDFGKSSFILESVLCSMFFMLLFPFGSHVVFNILVLFVVDSDL